jgi:hypothetical protein
MAENLNSLGIETQYRKPDLEQLRYGLGYKAGMPVDRQGNDKALLNKYEARFVRPDLPEKGPSKGKEILIDTRTGKKYDPKVAMRYIYLNKYGTETPDEDYAYLDKKEYIERKTRTGPAGFRVALSRKTPDGVPLVEKRHKKYLDEQEKVLNELYKKTSLYKKELIAQQNKTKESSDVPLNVKKAQELLNKDKPVNEEGTNEGDTGEVNNDEDVPPTTKTNNVNKPNSVNNPKSTLIIPKANGNGKNNSLTVEKQASTPDDFLKKWDHSQYWGGGGFTQKDANTRDATILKNKLGISGSKLTNKELMQIAQNARTRGMDNMIFEGSKGRFLHIGNKRINLQGTGL